MYGLRSWCCNGGAVERPYIVADCRVVCFRPRAIRTNYARSPLLSLARNTGADETIRDCIAHTCIATVCIVRARIVLLWNQGRDIIFCTS